MSTKFRWSENDLFKEPFIVIGKWNFSNSKNFSHCEYVSADTETKLYYCNELLSEEKASEFYKNNGADWCRENIQVKAYAFMLSNGSE